LPDLRQLRNAVNAADCSLYSYYYFAMDAIVKERKDGRGNAAEKILLNYPIESNYLYLE